MSRSTRADGSSRFVFIPAKVVTARRDPSRTRRICPLTAPSSIPPVLTVVAGPNGSGKSTATSQLRLHDRMPVLDPDAIARIANASDPSRAAIAAGREVLLKWRRYVERRVSFAIETTLAGMSPIERIRQARIAGYGVRVYYVAIDPPELNVERVRRRVLQGGHGIPERDSRRRYDRSLTNPPVVLTLADQASVPDNSFHQAATVAEFEPGTISWRAPNAPMWAARILAAVER